MRLLNQADLAAAAILLLATGGAAQEPSGVLDLIDPLIGTIKGGHVFPGATLPFGMVKSGADTDGENQGGFDSASQLVRGFSHTHDSGTGGGSSMGNFPIFAHSACKGDVVDNCPFRVPDRATDWVKGSTKASPGYFGVTLNTSVSAETTVTNHSAIYRFTFPEMPAPPAQNATLSPLILVDLIDLSGTRSESQVTVDAKTGRLTGSGSFGPSFGSGRYSQYFCMDFKGAELRQAGVYMNSGPVIIDPESDGENPPGVPMGAFVQFKAPDKKNQILARVGISFISTEQACASAEKEQPEFDFDGTVAAAEAAWEEKLSVVEIKTEGVDRDFEVIFWSGIYRTMISPQDYTGENPLWESDEPYYDSYYCIWDSFRSIHPLLTILDPYSQTLMIHSLIDIYRHEGWLPDCRMSLCKGFTQGGSNADVVLVDAFVKNLAGIDWETGYEALIKDAEVQPPNWDLEGRGGLESWKSLGYIPIDDNPVGQGLHTRSVSRTVEYAYNDFCIGLIAKALGHDDDHTKYMNRSANWKNLYLANQTSAIDDEDTGFVGYLQPRNLDGTWNYQDPIHCSPLLNQHSCYLNDQGGESYEGSLWMYTFYVPQDMATLITTVGGPEAYTERLDFLHESGLLYMGDEQAFLPVYQYHYAGRPGLSAHRIHTYIPRLFNNNSPGGIPGNDDSGAMGSFIALAMMGLFPVAGQDVYLITPPFFPEVSITHGISGKVAIIRNVGFDPSYEAIYIQSVTRDGEEWTKNWIGHDFFAEGGVLELTLGPKESEWGTAEKDLPPSLSTGGFDG